MLHCILLKQLQILQKLYHCTANHKNCKLLTKEQKEGTAKILST